MIVGTAGHIDHGKSTVVRALTGIDTDRLPEEKARGISIALGYAYVRTAAGRELGFVDVPGHERFVHTMLAGATGIDYALLVIAADDGVMPQTREHAAILGLLGVGCGAVVITKADRVDSARLADTGRAVDALTAGTPLAPAPRFVVDARDPAAPAMRALHAELERAADSHVRRAGDGHFRLCVDRVFSLPGHGTIVTGTADAGSVRVGDVLALGTRRLPVRVRGLRAHNHETEAGYAGERLALNLAPVEAAAIGRGDWLAADHAVAISTRIDARLTLLPGAPPLPAYAAVHLHFGATHATARLLALEPDRPIAGRPAWVQFVLESPVGVPPGARFIVRDAAARQTLGGGVLVDASAPARRRRTARRAATVDALERALQTGDVAPLLAAAPWGYSLAALQDATGRPVPVALPAGVEVVARERDEAGTYLLATGRWAAAQEYALGALARYHAEHPAEPGPDLERWRARVDPDAPAGLFRHLVARLVEDGRIRRRGNWLQLAEHGALRDQRDEVDAARLLGLLAEGRFDPPWARDLARTLALPEARVRELLASLGRAGRAFPVVPDLYYAAPALAELAAIVDELAAGSSINAAEFRDRIGIGRKRAIQILEFFDRLGFTRRTRDGRVRRGTAPWSTDG